MTGVHVRARLLGAFDVEVDGRPLDRAAFERPSGLRVLKLLLATPGHRIRREAAAELLWPEADPERSGANLRKAVHFARRGLAGAAAKAPQDGILQGDAEWLRFAPDVRLDVDADRLADALDDLDRGGDALEALAELGGAELLPEDPYEEWLMPLRERLRRRVLAAALAGAAESRRRGNEGLAVKLVDRVLALDPAEESAHRALIEMHLEAGGLHAARRQLLACRRALADAYGVEPSGELVALVESASADRARIRVGTRQEPEIIGRRIELDRAEPVLDAVAGGHVGVLLLRGPAGIGKSRLLREVVRLAGASEWRVLELRGLEATADTAFSSLSTALESHLDPREVGGWEEPERSAMLTVVPALGERLADVASTSGRSTRKPAPLVAFATEGGLRSGLVAGLRRVAGERPLAVAVDDVQWLDGATVSLLRALFALDAALLLVMTLRDEPREGQPELQGLVDDVARHGGTEVRVGPLGRREIQLLLEREIDGAALAEGLGDTVADLAGGAPLYALQLLRGAQEIGAVSLRDGHWRMTAPGGSLPVPAGVLRLVEDRTARLAPDVRSILSVAAELGDEVSYELVVAAAGARPEAALDALDEGLSLDLLVEHGSRYRFAHPLFRAALRRKIPRRSRAQLHARIAAALARDVDPADQAAVAAAIGSGVDAVAVASHAGEAVELGALDAIALAIGFGFAAGARQNTLFDHAGAVATLRRALGLWYRLPSAAREAFPTSASQHHLGLALKALGEHGAAGEAFGAEVAMARDDMDRARGYAALSWLPYEHGRFDRSEELLRDGIRAVADPVARAFLESGLGWIRGRQGDWTAAHELLAPAVAVLEQGAPADLLARAVDRFAVAIRDRGQAQESIPVFRRALALCAESANLHEEAIVRMHLASALRDTGDMTRARQEVERSIALTRLTGDRYIEAVAHWILAEVEDTVGHLPEAAAARRTELGILEASGGNPQNQAMAHAHLAHIARRQGDERTVESETRAALSLANHAGLDYLPGLVERALEATDWFRVSHRHRDGEDPSDLSISPGQ